MNTNRNVSFGTGAGIAASGSEVESAMFRPEVMWDEPVSAEVGRRNVMGRIEQFKSRIGDRTSLIRSNVQQSMTTAKSSVRSSMRSSPEKWAAIAAGSGFALGLLGRFIQSRQERHRHMPQLVVIETSC
jgi:ElaB/YqjD/DUF883 family membrane-anchored ribosome-binding protein